MYYIKKTFEVSASHHLTLPYPSKCENDHGHNYIITVYCKSNELTDYGMVIDFTEIKSRIQDKLDHACLNNVFDFNPTAENMAKWIVDNLPTCYRADVEETKNNWACYEVDE